MATIYVAISEASPNLEVLAIVAESAKAYKVRNKDNGAECWLPKSGLKPRKPGEPSYADEYILAPWLRSKLSRWQEKALGILE